MLNELVESDVARAIRTEEHNRASTEEHDHRSVGLTDDGSGYVLIPWNVPARCIDFMNEYGVASSARWTRAASCAESSQSPFMLIVHQVCACDPRKHRAG
jgi:hypothetical protein